MNKRSRTIVAFVLVFLGLCCAVYPFVSNILAQQKRAEVEGLYQTEVQKIDTSWIDAEKNRALLYNQSLMSSRVTVTDPFDPENNIETTDEYEDLMNLAGNEIMGMIRIPSIGMRGIIYHGTGKEALANGVGHLKSTSLPFGGESSHCVLAGHTGLPTIKVFDALDKVQIGDLIFLEVLDETHAYCVYDIETVLPEETDSLVIQRDRDLLTLVTCTPYGINSHRLLVHAERCEAPAEVTSEPDLVKSTFLNMNRTELLVMLIADVIVVLMLVVAFIRRHKRRQKQSVDAA